MADDKEVKVDVDDFTGVNPSSGGAIPSPASSSPPQYSSDSPPDYDSIFGKIKKAQDESDGQMEFGRKMAGMICCSSVVGFVMIVICFAIPLAALILGAMNLKQCTIERYVPIYLVVFGVFGVLKACVDTGFKIKDMKSEDDTPDEDKKPNPVGSLINCFLFAWFIAGSVWVYRIYGSVEYDNSLSDNYCDRSTYLFAFAIITMTYALTGLMLLLCCCCCIFMCCSIAKAK